MIGNLKRIWAIFTPAEQRKAMWMLLLVLLMAAVEMLGVISVMPFLSVLSRPSVIEENRLLQMAYEYTGFDKPLDFIIALGLVSITLVVGSSAFKAITQHTLSRFVHLQRHAISVRLLSRYLHQPYEFFLDRNPSILTKNVLSEVDLLIFGLLQPLSQLIAQATIVLAMALLIFAYNPMIAACILVTLATLYGTIYWLVRKRLAHIGRKRQVANAQRYQACTETLNGIKDVKITHAADAYLQKFQQASREYSRHIAANDTLNQSPSHLVEATGYTGLIAIALVLLVRSNDVAQVLPALGLYGFAAYRMLPSAQAMYRGFAQLRSTSSALEHIHHDLMLPEEPRNAAPEKPMLLEREIHLHGISYAYPSMPDKPVLQDFDLVIPANSSIGIIGRSGSGKSTLMDILLGLLRPQSGTVSVDSTTIDSSNVAAWQKAIGYVPQHIYLADSSVAENIAFGLSGDLIDMQAVERAARAAQIHDFIVNELSHGYDTKVGDRGIRLSGGQRQRIGIARALYRDPPVLLFDEATSALDAKTETALQEDIRALSGNKTIIVITHKEQSLRDCRQIVRLGN
jgi:ABC-type multidrug transport system fused ATPase/permease subunit